MPDLRLPRQMIAQSSGAYQYSHDTGPKILIPIVEELEKLNKNPSEAVRKIAAMSLDRLESQAGGTAPAAAAVGSAGGAAAKAGGADEAVEEAAAAGAAEMEEEEAAPGQAPRWLEMLELLSSLRALTGTFYPKARRCCDVFIPLRSPVFHSAILFRGTMLLFCTTT